MPNAVTYIYVGKGGSDGNDGSTWALRKLTIAGATPGTLAGGVAVASVANTKTAIIVGPGTFSEVNKIALRSSATGNRGIDLIGSGIGATIIDSQVKLTDGSATNVYRGAAINPGNGSLMEDFTIRCTLTDGSFQACIGANISYDNAAQDYVARRVHMIGETDAFYDSYFGGADSRPSGFGQDVILEDCVIESRWDAVRTFESWQRTVLRRCSIFCYGPSVASLYDGATTGVYTTSGLIELHDCRIDVQEGTTTTYGVRTGGGRIDLYGNTSIATSSEDDNDADIYAASGSTVYSFGAHFDIEKTAGDGTISSVPSVAESITITPASAPAQTTAYLTTRNGAGTAKGSVTINFALMEGPGDAGHSYDRKPFAATSNSSGSLEVTLLREATYKAIRGDGNTYQFTTADASTYQMPEVIGYDV